MLSVCSVPAGLSFANDSFAAKISRFYFHSNSVHDQFLKRVFSGCFKHLGEPRVFGGEGLLNFWFEIAYLTKELAGTSGWRSKWGAGVIPPHTAQQDTIQIPQSATKWKIGLDITSLSPRGSLEDCAWQSLWRRIETCSPFFLCEATTRIVRKWSGRTKSTQESGAMCSG